MPNLDLLSSLIGPITPVSGSSSLGPSFAKYEQDFATYDASHWKTEGSKWDTSNYYDRAFINYVWYARTGDSVYLDRANALAADYLKNYVEADNYGVASWWSMPKGITAHYLLNGDQASLTAIGKMADQVVNPWNTENNWANLFDPHQSEGREQARALETLTQAILIDAPSVGVPNIQPNGEDWGVSGGNNFRALAKSLVEKILTSGFQHADGSRPNYVEGGALDGKPIDKPFMNGLMNEALMNYYEQVDPDPRIVQFIKANLNYMWAHEWDATAKAFQYIDKDSVKGVEDLPAADLNMLIVNGFGFVYKHTGDATYLYRGDLVFAGGVEGSWLEGSKQFNQQYASSYNYIAYTRGELNIPLAILDGDGTVAHDVLGTAAAEVLVGGANNDTISGLDAADKLYGQDGNDHLWGGAGNDRLFGGAGDDLLKGESGDDVLDGGHGADLIDGDVGVDLVSYIDAGGSVQIDLETGINAGQAVGDRLISIEQFQLSAYDDHFVGLAANAPVAVFGGAGADALYGSGGADWLDGGTGADQMRGATGNDVFIVDDVLDRVFELVDGGMDTIYSSVSIALPANVETLVLTGSRAANVVANALNNWITGNGAANRLVGGTGIDRMTGGGGSDTYYVDNWRDVVIETTNKGTDLVNSHVSYTLSANVEHLLLSGRAYSGVGNSLANSLVGNAAANFLDGGAGNDRIVAGLGNDIVRGGLGRDVVTGGGGRDLFDFNIHQESKNAAPDVITDFRHGEDRIDLAGIDANLRVGGNQAFSFLGAKAFSGHAGDLNVRHYGSGVTSTTRVYADINGDSHADIQIQFVGHINLTRADFIL